MQIAAIKAPAIRAHVSRFPIMASTRSNQALFFAQL